MLARGRERSTFPFSVSVAGCLGYDVLESLEKGEGSEIQGFSCWLFRL